MCPLAGSEQAERCREVAAQARPLPSGVEEALFAVTREALANIRQHSRATTAVVTLHCASEDVSLAVQDDGNGIPKLMPASYRDSTTYPGLRGMCRRVEELGGRFLVENGEERGMAAVMRASRAAGSDRAPGQGPQRRWAPALRTSRAV